MNARIYYASPEVVVMGDPCNGNHPVILLRHPGTPTKEEWKAVNRALLLCGMELIGKPAFRSDGLWYNHVKEVGNE